MFWRNSSSGSSGVTLEEVMTAIRGEIDYINVTEGGTYTLRNDGTDFTVWLTCPSSLLSVTLVMPDGIDNMEVKIGSTHDIASLNLLPNGISPNFVGLMVSMDLYKFVYVGDLFTVEN